MRRLLSLLVKTPFFLVLTLFKPLLLRLLELLDNFLIYLQKKQYPPISKNPYLNSHFAPVQKEIFEKGLRVIGTLPEDLDGEFVRVGPNPRFVPRGQYHWFDGDGMIHGVRISDGSANYVNRYVRTERFQIEEKLGRAEFLKIGDMLGKLGLARITLQGLKEKLNLLPYSTLDTMSKGTANTALVYHDGRLLSLVESSYPYHVKLSLDGLIETVGAYTYGSKLKHPFTAHPKVDDATGEMVFFGYDLRKEPYLTYSVVSSEGDLLRSVPITLPEPVMMHDFAITTNYSIFMDLPLVFRPKNIVKGFPFVFDPKKPARIGIIPRHATSEKEMKWFAISPCYSFHTANAWEQDDEIVLVAFRIEHFVLDSFMFEGEPTEPLEKREPYLYQWRINLKNHQVSEKKLCDIPGEFPRIHPKYLGKPNRYVYSAVASVDEKDQRFGGSFTGVFKYDLVEDRLVKKLSWGENRVGGECVFVPKNSDSKSDPNEDDGYLLTFITNTATESSQFVVLDARTMSSEFVAQVPLPQRVPSGFHGLFVPESELKGQRGLHQEDGEEE